MVNRIVISQKMIMIN